MVLCERLNLFALAQPQVAVTYVILVMHVLMAARRRSQVADSSSRVQAQV